MSPDKQRIAIAEACGWGLKPLVWQSEIVGYRLIKPDGKVFLFDHWTEGAKECKSWEFACARDVIPNYLTDLNAMHEAEKAKEMAFDSDYAYWLAHVAVRDRGLNEDKLDVGDGYQIALTSTAAQRAEAFLRTVGKWEQGK